MLDLPRTTLEGSGDRVKITLKRNGAVFESTATQLDNWAISQIRKGVAEPVQASEQKESKDD